MELRCTQYQKKGERSELISQVQHKLNYVGAGRWQSIRVDGIFGPETRQAVIAYQRYRHITPSGGLGVIDDYTLSLMLNEMELYLTPAPGPMITATPAPVAQKSSHPIVDTTLVVYDTATKPIEATFGATNSLCSIDKIVSRWQSVIKQQIDNLRRRASSIPQKKPMRVRNLQKQLEKANEFINQSKRYGLKTGLIMYKDLTKDSVIKYMREIADVFEDARLLKLLNATKSIIDKLKRAIKPIIDILNKIPGLKYLSVIDKLIKGTLNLIKFDFEKALALFIDGLRELVENLLIDMAIAALIAAGGWIALVVGIVLVVGAMVLDYFLFNEDSGNTLVDKYTSIKTYNASEYTASKLYGLVK